MLLLLKLPSPALLLPACAVWLAVFCPPADADAVYNALGASLEVRLQPEKPVVMVGEPTYLAFVVQNPSEKDLQVIVGGDYQNRLGRPERFSVTVTRDEDRTKAQEPEAGPEMGGIEGPQPIPAHGQWTTKLFLPHWATIVRPGHYTITAKRTLNLLPGKPGQWDSQQKTTDVPTEATAHLEVVPADREKMGEVIRRWGTAFLDPRDNVSEEAAAPLAAVDDNRVIPYLQRGMATDSYERKFEALESLAKFNTAEAFESVKEGINTRGSQIGNCTTPQVAASLAQNIRLAAAYALARSPYPDALECLLSHRHDPYNGVRTVAVQNMDRLPRPRALPLLEEMTHDPDRTVSDEAARILKEVRAQ